MEFKLNNHYKVVYPSYAGNGFGYLTYHGTLLCNNSNDWLKVHYRKYPGGVLPEQTIVRGRVK